MNRSNAEMRKIQPHHLGRAAYVYVRQSSPRQVTEHLESRRRQYERVDWALAEGWPRERIEVIDEDQGKSGGRPTRAPASRDWCRRSRKDLSALSLRWRSRGCRATARTGITCCIYAASPRR